MKSDLVESFIRLALNEAMKSPEEAKSEGLALVKGNSGSGSMYILYDAKFLLRLTRKMLEKRDAVYRLMDYVSTINDLNPADYVVGVIRVGKASGPCNGAWQVEFSAAKSGYGPLMYDIALGDYDLIPDRTNVSDEAGSVWEKYYKARKDVERKKLDDIDNPKTPPKSDDCQTYNHSDRFWLDYSYTKKSKINASSLYQNHKVFMTALKNMFDVLGAEKHFKRDMIQKSIVDSAFSYFIDKFASNI